MMKKMIIFNVLAILVISTVLLHTANASGTTMYLTPSPVYAQPGDEFSVELRVTNATSLWSWKAEITWNSSVMKFTGVTEGPFMSSNARTLFLHPPPYENRTIEVSCTRLQNDGASGDGSLATLNFKLLRAVSSSPITLNDTVLLTIGSDLTSQSLNSTSILSHQALPHTDIGTTLEIGSNLTKQTDSPIQNPILIVGVLVITGVAVVSAAFIARGKGTTHQKKGGK